ncbi:sulfotransferase family protein [Nonomuraea lactucae]|uniref:sulfotransferase family protein n=1 Tax=Nonomuraea lactucae TaxID=2249762 RepID=UPI0013B3E982|nr:sulfotransferase [Nonomuraea lactucae]
MPDFLIGTGRCGSTLAYEVLAHHPQVSFVSRLDNRWPRAPRPLRRHGGTIYRRLPSALAARSRLRLGPSEAYPALAREVSAVMTDPYRDLHAEDVTPWLAQRLRTFFDGRAAPGTRLVHKFTGWPRAAFLHEVFPEARFVHMVRDGRAVANSLAQMPWWRGHRGTPGWRFGPLPAGYAEEWERGDQCLVLLAGLGWKAMMDAYEAARAAVPSGQWLEIRYEDLLRDPRKHMELILGFYDLPWTRDFELALDRMRFSTARAEAYRTDLTPRQLALLDASLAAHLHRYGYHT